MQNKRLKQLFKPVLITTILLIFMQGCSIRRMTRKYISNVSESLSIALFRQPDPELAKDGGATFLIAIDSMIQNDPGNERLLLAGLQGYSAYASAFLLETEPARAFTLFNHALQYGVDLCRIRLNTPAINTLNLDELKELLSRTEVTDVDVIYWTASAWAGWMIVHPDKMLGIADLSKVETMMERVLQLDQSYQDGGPHIFFALYHSSRPPALGGDFDKARFHFEKAMEYAGSEALLPQVLYAKHYARKLLDEALFTSTLKAVISAPPPKNSDLNLMNAIAKQRAQHLLDNMEDYF
jgi:TRAP transporter T-component